MNVPIRYDGRLMLIDGVEHTVVGVGSAGAILLGPDGAEHVVSQDEFRSAISSGRVFDRREEAGLRLSTAREANDHRFRQKVLARMDQHRRGGLKVEAARMAVERELRDDPTFLARQRPFPSLRAIQGWNATVRSKGNKALAPREYLRGNRKDRHDEHFEKIALDFLEEEFFKTDRLTVSDAAATIADRYLKKCEELDIEPAPHGRLLVEKIIDWVPHDEALKRRLGLQESRKHRIKAVRYVAPEAPLDLIELDCTTGDAFIVDREGRTTGRPTICAAIDTATGWPLGLQLKLGAPNSLLTAATIKEIFVPKDDAFFETFDIGNRFQAFGRFAVLSTDQGSENSGDIIQNAVRVLSFELGSGLPAHPEKRPHVERFFRELNAFLRKLPGGIGSSLLPERERHDKAMAEACYTLEQLEKLVQQWRYDAYGPRPRRRIMSALLTGEAPVDCWKRLAAEHVLPDPPSPDQIAEIFMVPSAARSLQHYGVEFNGIQYHGPALRRILENHGRQTRVEIRYDPTDIRMIMVRDPDTGTHVPVSAKEPDLPAISFATLTALRAANPEWTSGDITARAIALAIATGTYRSATAPRSKTARRRHEEVGKREREEIARRSRTAPKIAASAAPDDQIALPAPMLGIPRPTRPTEISTKK
jgi:hypothetical protein